jgi:hypothetical protein
MPVSVDAFFVSEGLKQTLAQAYCDVFGRMVRINIQIAFGFYDHVDFAVFAQVCEHVVQETDTRVDLEFADTIEIKLNGNVGFLCLSMNLRGSLIHENVPVPIRFVSALKSAYRFARLCRR